ncbi:MAG: protein kinase, partial [Actinomycetota bacterium]
MGYLPEVAQATVILDDRYELGPVLGNGGMARVHKGMDRQLKRSVAVKVLSSPFDQDKEFVERFRREAHAAARLNHPNIVAVYDSGSDDGTHYIVTELVEGETLADLLQREGALPPERVVEIARQVCHALEAAHEKGVVHRDVKPGNVMITPEGRVKVVDFGIARAAGAESVTRTGLVMGSASYLSPEQARGEPGDERSDIYSLGCVLYQMLTGRPPFVAENPISALYQHVN